MDIGIQMGWEVFEDKLEERENPRRRELSWNLTRLPKLDGAGTNRLFVAVKGAWQGYFVLKNEVLLSPEDARCPYALIFDPRSWVEIRPLQAARFRGFTYDTPDPTQVVRAGAATGDLSRRPGPGSTGPAMGGSQPPAGGSVSDRH